MFGFLENVAKAAVGVVSLPVTVAADVVTMAGAMTDQDKPYTATAAESILKNLQKAVEVDD